MVPFVARSCCGFREILRHILPESRDSAGMEYDTALQNTPGEEATTDEKLTAIASFKVSHWTAS